MKNDGEMAMCEFLSWDWTPVKVEAWRALRFVHVTTRYCGTNVEDCRRGDTLWAAADTSSKAKIGLAWEWVESEPGNGLFFASIQDLMSNAVLTDAVGIELDNYQLSAELLSSVESLPWRSQVTAQIAGAAH